MPRELIDTTRDKRFVRRGEGGRFDKMVDIGKSLARDTRRKAQRTVAAGEGDRGDQKTSAPTKTRSSSRAKARSGAGTKARAASRSKARSAAPSRRSKHGPSRQAKAKATESRKRARRIDWRSTKKAGLR